MNMHSSETYTTGCGKMYKTERGYMGHIHTCRSCIGQMKAMDLEKTVSSLKAELEEVKKTSELELRSLHASYDSRIDMLNHQFQDKLVDATMHAVKHGAKLMLASSEYHKQMARDFIELCRTQARLAPGSTMASTIEDATYSLKEITEDTSEDMETRQRANALLLCQQDKSSQLFKTVNSAIVALTK